jgi:hypothetical protein
MFLNLAGNYLEFFKPTESMINFPLCVFFNNACQRFFSIPPEFSQALWNVPAHLYRGPSRQSRKVELS